MQRRRNITVVELSDDSQPNSKTSTKSDNLSIVSVPKSSYFLDRPRKRKTIQPLQVMFNQIDLTTEDSGSDSVEEISKRRIYRANSRRVSDQTSNTQSTENLQRQSSFDTDQTEYFSVDSETSKSKEIIELLDSDIEIVEEVDNEVAKRHFFEVV